MNAAAASISSDFDGAEALATTHLHVMTTETVGRYRLARPIKRGGMAEVYEAFLEGTGGFARRFALKRPLEGSELLHLAAFADEARILSQLDHPGIVSVFDFGSHEGWPYQVLEFVDGLDLASLRLLAEERGLRIPAAHALSMIADAAEALHYAHHATDWEGRPLGVVHRDVSPHNIIVSWRGEVKVLDFGIAMAHGRLASTQAGIVKGKLSFMSPEQLAGARVTPKADVFSLGCVLHHLLAGESPYADLSARTVAAGGEDVPLQSLLDDDVQEIVRRAAAYDPAHRFESAAALARACNAALSRRGQLRREAIAEWLQRMRAPDTGAVRRPASVVVVGINAQEDAETVADLEMVDLAESAPTSREGTPRRRCGRFRLGRKLDLADGLYEGQDSESKVAVRTNVSPKMLEEAATLISVDHDNLLDVRELGSTEDRLFFVTAPLEGRSLAKLMADAAPCGLEPAEMAAIGAGAIGGLVAARHLGRRRSARPARDVRPETLFITYDGFPKLVDVLVDGPINTVEEPDGVEAEALKRTLLALAAGEPNVRAIAASLDGATSLAALRQVQAQLTSLAESKGGRSTPAIIAELMLRLYGREAAEAQSRRSREMRTPSSARDEVAPTELGPEEPSRTKVRLLALGLAFLAGAVLLLVVS